MTVRILIGDVRARLRELPADSVQCCVTSPPYWGLRSYLPEGHPDKQLEIGSEATIDEWVDTMVDVFREVRRVLRPDGTLFLNLGDSYSSGGRGSYDVDGNKRNVGARGVARPRPSDGIKDKDLVGQPWMVAFALRADGWWLRQEIIWAKPNPMPESVTDRCTKAHEQVFLLTKSDRYFWNFEDVQEPVSPGTHARLSQDVESQVGSFRAHAGEERDGRPMKAVGRKPGNVTHKYVAEYDGSGDERHRTKAGLLNYSRKLAAADSGTKNNESFDDAMAIMPTSRNPRTVWTIASESFKGAHYATFPTELPRRCITAGTREGDMVLDPFLGSGTTAIVADRMGRDCIDIDTRNEKMATDRLTADVAHVSRTRPLFPKEETA